jgi:hypothetical protein
LLGFLALLTFLVLGYSAWTAHKILSYWSLSDRVAVQSVEWSVLPLEEDEIAVQGHYHYQFKGQAYIQTEVLPERYLNLWAAKEAAARLSAKSWQVWINPAAPLDSTLQKKFPLKESLYTALLWILLLYFIGLGYYAARYS